MLQHPPQPCPHPNSHSAPHLLLLDATAFLLERTGDVRGALHMLVSAVHERAKALRAVLIRLDSREFAAFVGSLLLQGGGAGVTVVGGGEGEGAMTPGQLRRKGVVRKVCMWVG